MKLFLVLVMLVFAGACGQKPPVETAPPMPSNTELRSAITVKADNGAKYLEFVFFIGTSTVPGVKTGEPNQPVKVTEPMLNGNPLSETTDAAGQTVYKIDASKVKDLNEVTAKVDGKNYLAKATIPTFRTEAIITIRLLPN